jgi:D-alanyl-lipoteichoic acid acyltransferase DltB (MBOAT superfamily)
MAIVSLNFMIFSFLIIGLSYLSKNIKYRKIILLISGILFYYSFSTINLLYLLILLIFTFFVEKIFKKKKSKILLFISVMILVIYLSLFKYTNLLMPVGISFYIFKMISYIVDGYNGKNKKIDLLSYSVFIMFFPLIIMGPINNAEKFLEQINKGLKFEYKPVHDGFLLFFFGFFEKIVITNRLHVIVNNIFNNYHDYDSIYLVLVVVLYTFEIYTDFDSYSNMAIGLAKMLGIKVNKNFNVPYMSKNIREFWQRWHISLSTWLKEYIYIPLGGNRKGPIRKYLNILIVFFVSGIWHGNNINFLIWGLLNGVAQIINIIYSNLVSSKIKSNFFTKLLSIVVTFVTVNFLWIFFRSSSLDEAIYIIRNILFIKNINFVYMLIDVSKRDFIITGLLLIGFIIVDIIRYKISIIGLVNKSPLLARWSIYIIIILMIVVFGVYGINYNASDFIYNQF